MVKRFIIYLATLVAPLAAAGQPLDHAARMDLAAEVAGFAAAPAPQASAALMDRLGLDWPDLSIPDLVPVPFTQSGDALVELVDIRLILAQIAVQSGARDHGALTRAQGAGSQDVILLRGGFVGLDALYALSRDTDAAQAITATPGGLVLTKPLAIWSDAGLTLAAGEILTLARDHGSFIVNLGRFDLTGAAITGSLAINTDEPAFRPFVLSAAQGSLTAQDTAFTRLGFGTTPGFGGVAIVNSGLIAAQSPSYIVQSHLSDVTTLALTGTRQARITGNLITDTAGPAIRIAGAQDTLIADNEISRASGPQAIRVTAGAHDVAIIANRLTGPTNTGILIDGASTDLRIMGNLVVNATRTGIVVDRARCLAITGNLVAANGGAGISLRATDSADLHGNAVLFNAGAGLLLRDQSMDAAVQITGNTLAGNRDGLRGATPGAPVIADNDLAGQMPRVFTGDLANRMVPWLRAQTQALPVAQNLPAACIMDAG